jgi:hypothetical protein
VAVRTDVSEERIASFVWQESATPRHMPEDGILLGMSEFVVWPHEATQGHAGLNIWPGFTICTLSLSLRQFH